LFLLLNISRCYEGSTGPNGVPYSRSTKIWRIRIESPGWNA
jgi:hypothetical protein